MLEDDKAGNSIELSDENDLATLRIIVNQAYREADPASLENRLPGAVGVESYGQRQTTHEGNPALRFERRYLATGNGPMLRVNGLITSTERHLFSVQCGVVVHPFNDPHTTQTPPSEQPRSVEWTSAIDQATTRIIDSFTLKT